MTPIHRRRKSDKYPSREYLIEQQRDRALAEVAELRAEVARLRGLLEETKPMELT